MQNYALDLWCTTIKAWFISSILQTYLLFFYRSLTKTVVDKDVKKEIEKNQQVSVSTFQFYWTISITKWLLLNKQLNFIYYVVLNFDNNKIKLAYDYRITLVFPDTEFYVMLMYPSVGAYEMAFGLIKGRNLCTV